jgi:hypothetical protein
MRVLSLPAKLVHRPVPSQRLLYCHLFTQMLLGNVFTRHNSYRRTSKKTEIKYDGIFCDTTPYDLDEIFQSLGKKYCAHV